jgi:hypothetical protein
MSMFGTARTRARRSARVGTVAVAVAVAASAVLAACGSSTPTTPSGAGGSAGSVTGSSGATKGTTPADPNIPAVKLTASESGDMFSFNGPSETAAGPLLVELTNNGKLEHQAGVAKLKDGVTFDQVDQTFKGPNPTLALALADLYGGPNGVAPGATGKAIVNLPAGNYVVYCFIADDAGKPHVAHGMYKQLTVTAGSTSSTGTTKAADPVAAVGTITIKDFSVILPDDFTGQGWYKVVNEGPQAHEAVAYQLAPGKTAEDFKTFQSASDDAAAGKGTVPTTPRPIIPAGGAAAVNAGVDQWVFLDLDASQHYVFVCFVPDVSKGFVPHWSEGMITPWPTKS